MSKHTPGHWFYSAKLSGSENHRGFSVLNQSGWRLAEVQPIDPDGIEGEANARLIAAAPRMLHELYAAAAQIESLGGDASTQRAAIAAAKGKQ